MRGSNATAAGLTGTFRALMATSTASAASRFNTAGATGATAPSSSSRAPLDFGSGSRSCASTVGTVRVYCLQQ